MARILLVAAPENAADRIDPLILAEEDWPADVWKRLEGQAAHNRERLGRYSITTCVHPESWGGCGRRASIITRIRLREDGDSLVSWSCLICKVDFDRAMSAKEHRQRH